ncbi:MAG: Na/Pi cotransporter family protein [Alphaproteobacteria bacterium]|nr:Na/Pi cotransporter family protein [Alphaproteobacteria bacterium]
MVIIQFLLELAAATILLLFAVRMVRTGIERAFGASFRRLMTGSRARVRASLAGLALAAIMQSSVAVAMLVAGFVGAGTLSFQIGLPAMLGADLGSALVIQFLSMEISWLAPLLLVGGGVMFLKSRSAMPKQIGRAVLGVALILVALELMRATVMPIRDSAFLPQISALLERDFLTAFLVGAVLTFVMHSSVAAVLMFVTLVAIGALPLMVGISLMLGANLGSSLLPVWMTRAMPPKARHVPAVNALLRGSAAIIMVIVVNRSPLIEVLPDVGDGQKIILGHVMFNALLLLAVPFSGLLGQMTGRLIPEPLVGHEDTPAHYRSVLNPAALDAPSLAMACIRREIHRMLQIVEEMMLPVMDLIEDFDKDRMARIVEKDSVINEALDGTRRYVAELSGPNGPQNGPQNGRANHRKELRNLLEFAIAIEAAGDVVSKTLSQLAVTRARDDIRFSPEGLAELRGMHDRVVANIALAGNVLVSGDVGIARRLLEEKGEFTCRQRKSRKSHLKRLAKGRVESLESSDLHLETGLAFKEFNSHIASIAYPILSREGQLLDSRLIAED